MLFLLAYGTNGIGQKYLFNIEVIGVQDGLPNRKVYDITQDRTGFIWLSAMGAIYKYDGIYFKKYDHHLLNIPQDIVPFISIDYNNTVWYNTSYSKKQYFGILDPKKDSIYTIDYATSQNIKAKHVDCISRHNHHQYKVLIYTDKQKLWLYDKNPRYISLPSMPNSFTPRSIQYNGKKNFWLIAKHQLLGIENGKIKINVKTKHTLQRVYSFNNKPIIETRIIPSKKTPTKHWVIEGDSLVPFQLQNHPIDYIRSILQIHKDYIVYATKNSIIAENHEGKIIYQFDLSDIISNSFTPISHFIDQQQNIWLTSEDGLIKINIKENPFKILQKGNSIRGIYKKNNFLWTGGYSGTFVQNTDSNIIQKIPNETTPAFSFQETVDGNIMVGGLGRKIVEYTLEGKKEKQYTLAIHSKFIYRDTISNKYWIASDNELIIWDKTTNITKKIHLPQWDIKARIRQLQNTSLGLCLVTSKGFFIIDVNIAQVVRHYSQKDGLPNDNLNYIHESSNGTFWFGTRGHGLIKWNSAQNEYQLYSIKDGLSNNNIYAIVEDDYQNLWLSSDYGLIFFNKKNSTTKVYLPQNGIAHEEFNLHASFKDSNGEIYLGGLNGIIHFNPRNFYKEDSFSPSLHVNDIEVLTQTAKTFKSLLGEYQNHNLINLKASDKILRLNLALLDYENTSFNQYAYTIDTNQNQWIHSLSPSISIINPPYGKHLLTIKARGASGKWSNSHLSIPLFVKKPFYLEWYFFLILIISIVILTLIIIRWREHNLITNQKLLEKEVEKRTDKIATQAEKIKALDKAKTHFFANITHEFRTPLTLLIGPIEQMIKKLPSPEITKEKLNLVLKNAQNILGLINQLLDIAKLEDKKMVLEITHGDLVAYTKGIIDLFTSANNDKLLTLNFSSSHTNFETYFDKDKWHKIITNLLSNAVKFTPKQGKVLLHLEVIPDQKIQLTIADTGVGIPPNKLPYIFDRFYQADDSSSNYNTGTGIGLALVKEFVELQNGSIQVNSILNKGTSFIITLPLFLNNKKVLETETVTELTTNNTLPDDSSLDQDKLTLLIIEDNREMRAYIRSCINESQYDIIEAINGEDGIKKAQKIVPDLIISDVMMPKKNGFEVVNAIRTHVATSHIPLILLSARAALESRLEGLNRGADVYLTKPFSPKELVIRIHKLIEIRNILQNRYQKIATKPSSVLDESIPFQKEDSFIEELTNYILSNIDSNNLNAQSIGLHFGISRAQVYRKTDALIKIPIAQYIRSIRLKEAIKMLKDEELSLSEIAYKVGFTSLSRFSKVFKRVYGIPPSEWKKNNLPN